jgi:predicted lactoylglutathione lyase
MAANRTLFVNLAVEDLDRSVAFFTALGFTFDPRFTDDTATCMVINDHAFAMLLVKERFRDFIDKEIVDSTQQTEAIMALSAEGRDDVDSLVRTALAAGGTSAREPMDYGFMYGHSFHDPDGHLWEVMWMDVEEFERAQAERTAASA